MIDVEIQGPVAKKEYDKLMKQLALAGEDAHEGFQVTLAYSDKGFNNREVHLEYRNGAARIFIHAGKTGSREEIATELARGAFSDAVHMLAELGYKKGTVTARKVFSARYGGAVFSLSDPDGESFHYAAAMGAANPAEAKEAKQKLEKLARNFKLPMWTALEMLEFMRRLDSTARSVYDYDADGQAYFKNTFGIS